LIVGALIGGSIGDALDRRRVLLVASSLLSLTSGALAVNAAFIHPSIVAIYLISALAAGLGGIVSTTCNAAVSSFVSEHKLTAAYAAMQVADQVGMVLGPALSGLLIGAVHLPWVYALDAGTFVFSALAALRMAAIPPVPGAGRPGLGSILAGLRYICGRQMLLGAYLIDLGATVFGLPMALFPALARSTFHGGPSVLGFLYAAPAAGALLGALATGWLPRIRHLAWAVIVAVCVWGAAIVAFGFIHVLWVALTLLAVAGWADVISAVLRNTLLQTAVDEAYRSRISSVQMAVVEGGPRLGGLESGAVATAVSTQFSIVSGGIACIVGALVLAVALPGFRQYARRTSARDESAATPTGASSTLPEGDARDRP
jgi:MFS family permease